MGVKHLREILHVAHVPFETSLWAGWFVALVGTSQQTLGTRSLTLALITAARLHPWGAACRSARVWWGRIWDGGAVRLVLTSKQLVSDLSLLPCRRSAWLRLRSIRGFLLCSQNPWEAVTVSRAEPEEMLFGNWEILKVLGHKLLERQGVAGAGERGTPVYSAVDASLLQFSVGRKSEVRAQGCQKLVPLLVTSVWK